MPDATDTLLEHLSAARRVLITTHVRPDGDALGSVGALALALRARGVHTEQLLLSHLPTKYRFVFENAGLDHHDVERGNGAAVLSGLDAFDTLLIADTGTFSQLPGLEGALKSFAGRVLVIDHHKTQEPWGTTRLVDTSCSSAAELVARTLKHWGTPLTREIAEAVYVGVVSDTGWFQFSNTSPATLRLAAELMEAGVDPDRIYQRLYQSEREPRLRLQTRAMDSLQLHAGGRLAVMRITKQDFADTQAGVPDTENVINFPLQLAAVQMSLLFTETPEGGPIRISCRSKGQVDVAKFAEQFGGGGHARASGLKLNASLAEALDRVTGAATAALAE